MLILPGEQGSSYIINSETGEKVFYEPKPKIGMRAKCEVIKATISGLDLRITHLDGEKVHMIHKAFYKPAFINQDETAKFLTDEFEPAELFNGIISDLCDLNGILIKKEIL